MECEENLTSSAVVNFAKGSITTASSPDINQEKGIERQSNMFSSPECKQDTKGTNETKSSCVTLYAELRTQAVVERKRNEQIAGEVKSQRKAAFTLAEVLITLGIIGIVAALTFPTLMESVTERRNSERHANIAYKVTQAMELMKAHGELGRKYETTEAFVDELQKYLKISKRCDANHIAECWPTDKVIDGDGNEFEVSKAKTGKNLSLTTNTNNVGLVLVDGTPLILNYNPDAGRIDEGTAVTAVYKSLPVGGGKSKKFAFTSTVTNGIDFVTDVNGSHGPNKETADNKYNDIRNLTVAKFTKGCAGTDIPGIGCVVNVGTSYDAVGTFQYYGSTFPNYWEGAKAKCVSMGMTLPDVNTLKSIYNQKGNYDTLPQSGWFCSSSEVDTYTAWYVNFDDWSEYDGDKFAQLEVLCVGN